MSEAARLTVLVASYLEPEHVERDEKAVRVGGVCPDPGVEIACRSRQTMRGELIARKLIANIKSEGPGP